jgi:hypothetical protein
MVVIAWTSSGRAIHPICFVNSRERLIELTITPKNVRQPLVGWPAAPNGAQQPMQTNRFKAADPERTSVLEAHRTSRPNKEA